uniref:Uncharacterized protein n=1 Tax=Globodera rostochiensis TaxID=31243 RepID=A0A914HK68_GLORO
MLTFCFLLGNANNQNANSTDPKDSEAHINATVFSPNDLRDINGGHHDDHAEPSTSHSQNILSSESEATSDSDFQTPHATLSDNKGPKNDSEDENIQKATEESLKEHQTKRNNAKNDDDELKKLKKQSEPDDEQAEIQPKPKLASIDIQEDGLTDAELKALHRLNSNATPNKVLKYLNEASRAKVLQAFEHINGNGAESSWMAENRAPARNETPTQQETPNESDGMDDSEFEALEELINGNEEVLSKLNKTSRLKVFKAARKLGVELPRENEITNESDGLDDLEEEALEELINGNEEVLSELNEKSRLKVRNVAKKLGVEESSTSAVGQQQMKVSPYLDQYHWRNFLLEGGWDYDKTNQYYGDLSNPNISRSKSMAQQGGTLSAKRPLKGFLQALQAAQFDRSTETASESEDELPARSKHQNMPGGRPGVPRNKEMLALGAQLRQMSIGKSREMPTASYGNMSQTDVDRGLLAKLIERSNHGDLGMDSATAQNKKAKKEKQKKWHFDKNLSEHENGSSTDSP